MTPAGTLERVTKKNLEENVIELPIKKSGDDLIEIPTNGPKGDIIWPPIKGLEEQQKQKQKMEDYNGGLLLREIVPEESIEEILVNLLKKSVFCFFKAII